MRSLSSSFKRFSLRSIWGVLLCALLLLLLPFSMVERLRGGLLTCFSPSLRALHKITPHQQEERGAHAEELEYEILRLEQELALLQQVEGDWGELRATSALPARVIYRTPEAWSSSFWINRGRADNERLGYEAVGVGSPILSGRALVGLVDRMTERAARVRLITDPHFYPSVRVLRGGEECQELLTHVDALLPSLWRSEEEEKKTLAAALFAFRDRLVLESQQGRFLAKGQVGGAPAVHGRCRSGRLRGFGFNYDFPDLYGPARDLRSGEILPQREDPISLVEVGDLLVTTGFDGFFPPGLWVGRVTEVKPLSEGGISYELFAEPACAHLDQLRSCLILPPDRRPPLEGATLPAQEDGRGDLALHTR